MRIGPTIHYNEGCKLYTYIHYSAGADEFAIMHMCGNRFSSQEDFFIPFQFCPNHNAGHNYVHVHVRTSVQVLLEEAHKWNSIFCS